MTFAKNHFDIPLWIPEGELEVLKSVEVMAPGALALVGHAWLIVGVSVVVASAGAEVGRRFGPLRR